jgi:hypothetical protein
MGINERINQVHIKEGVNSWYLRVGDVHNFFCKCGRAYQFFKGIPFREHHPTHRCGHCGNTYYIDSEMFLYNFKVKIWKEIHCEALQRRDENGWTFTSIIKVPKFDFSTQTIYFDRMEVMYAQMGINGFSLSELLEYELLHRQVFNGRRKPRKLKELLEKETQERLLDFIERTPHEKIVWLLDAPEYRQLENIEERLKAIEFFLEFDRVKNFEFFRWKNINQFHLPGLGWDENDMIDWEKPKEFFNGYTIEEMLAKVL